MKRTKIIIALLLIGPFQAWAARPLDTDDAGTVEKGKIETEISFDYCRYRPEGNCQSPAFSIKHGLIDRLDFGLGFSHSTEKDADGNSVAWGMSPLEIGLKMALLKESQVLPDISLCAGFETGEAEYGLNLIFSRGYGNLGLHYNLGYHASGEAMVKGSIVTSLAAEYTLLEKFRICGELNSEILDDRSEVLGNSGLIGGSSDFGLLIWDLGVRIYDKRGPKATITTGITAGF
jgi:hypothetical protein